MKKIKKETKHCTIDFGSGPYLLSRFSIKGQFYIAFISLEDGNRWNEPAEIDSDEFSIVWSGNKTEIKELIAKYISISGYPVSTKKIKILKNFA